jgi:hypothetical protein
MWVTGSYTIPPQNGPYLNPIATQSLFLVNKARQRSIGTKTGAASMHHVAGVAQFNLSFFLIGVNYENHSHCVNDKNASGYCLRFPYVNDKNAM